MTSVELLLGNDYYLDIAMSQKMEVLLGLCLLSSKLGRILAWGVICEHDEMNVPNMLILTHGQMQHKLTCFEV